VNDIESRIRDLLNESVDAELGSPRPAPPFHPRIVGKRWRLASWVTPLIAAASVAALVGGTVAIAHVVSGHRQLRPATSVVPTPVPTTALPTPTSPTSGPAQHTTAPHATSSPTASKPANKTTNSPPPAPSGRWTDSKVVISTHSLGAVIRGMTLVQAEAAAGIGLSLVGDGIFRPTDRTITGSAVLQFSWGATCFDAARSTSGPGTTVTTSAGVRLGDPMGKISAAYGSMAGPFTADPNWTGAGNIPAGIIVRLHDGVLLFVGSSPDRRHGTITSIRGAVDAFHASSVFC
jgi:hypothetical protein